MKKLTFLILFSLLCVVTFSYHVATYREASFSLPEAPVHYDHLSFIPDDYYQTIMNAAVRYHVPVYYFAKLIETESRFNARAVAGPNSNGTYDYGIAQINSAYVDEFAFRYGYDKLDPFDPHTSIEVAAKHLKTLYRHTGSWELAFAAYNCGLSAVRQGRIPQSTLKYVATIMGGI